MHSNAVTQITEHCYERPHHRTAYLACGPVDGPQLYFLHGWPDLAWGWRHQMRAFAALGWRCIAPDMRGYGNSSVYPRHADYAQQNVVADMLALHDHLGGRPGVWVGHDWGSPTVWTLAARYPARCRAVANLCVPYGLLMGMSFDEMIALVDREIYPLHEYPAGQWEYQAFYREDFERSIKVLEANIYNSVKVIFRAGKPAHVGHPTATAMVRKNRGFFGRRDAAPNFPLDESVLSQSDLARYAEAFSRNGYFGPCSYYMNHEANYSYAHDGGEAQTLAMPVLFVHARYDGTCETLNSRLADPMRRVCQDLTERIVDSGHWMAQEKPLDVNRALVSWLVGKLPSDWGLS